MKQKSLPLIFTFYLFIGYSLTAQATSNREIPIDETNNTACEIPQNSKPQRLSDALHTPIQDDCKGKVYNLSGNFIVDDIVEFSNPYTRITMSPDSKITVKNTGSLRLSNTLIAACDSIWKGLLVEEGGELLLKNSFIEQTLLPYPSTKSEQIGTIAFYPNPAYNETVLKLSLSADQNKSEINANKCVMTDESGIRHTLLLKSSSSNNEYSINLSNLKSGFYQVIVSNSLDQNLFVGKVLVAHN
jgi:hypothetical protein